MFTEKVLTVTISVPVNSDCPRDMYCLTGTSNTSHHRPNARGAEFIGKPLEASDGRERHRRLSQGYGGGRGISSPVAPTDTGLIEFFKAEGPICFLRE